MVGVSDTQRKYKRSVHDSSVLQLPDEAPRRFWCRSGSRETHDYVEPDPLRFSQQVLAICGGGEDYSVSKTLKMIRDATLRPRSTEAG